MTPAACPSCGHENRLGAKFCARCRTGLPRGCPACGAPAALDDLFCTECGADLPEAAARAQPGPRQPTGAVTSPTAAVAPAPDSAERRQLTVLFCDLVGSTALSERLDPEDLRTVLQAYTNAAAGAIAAHGGHVARIVGDGLLVYFGYPTAQEDAAARAARAGLAIVEAVGRLADPVRRDFGVELHVRVGVHTGWRSSARCAAARSTTRRRWSARRRTSPRGSRGWPARTRS